MLISEMVRTLNRIKKERGDIEVMVDLDSAKAAHDEYTYEADFGLEFKKIRLSDPDTYRPERKLTKVVALEF